jgi:hypothetical protein
MKDGLRCLVFGTVLLAASATVSAAEVEFKSPGVQGNTGVGCKLSRLLPARFRVLATGDHAGRESALQIDQSGHAATEFDVAVHSPDLPVVVVLGGHEPTVWRIGWSEKTRIAAVVASGSHRQIVLGVTKGTPVLILAAGARGECSSFGPFYSGGRRDRENQADADRALRAVVGQGIDDVYAPKARGVAVLGEPSGSERWMTSDELKLSDYVSPGLPRAGHLGIEDAARKGLLRPATDADVRAALNAWRDVRSAGAKPVSAAIQAWFENQLRSERERGRVWVVQQAFTYPAGLYGSNSETFLVAKGAPDPAGNPGHSTVLSIPSGECKGPSCSR